MSLLDTKEGRSDCLWALAEYERRDDTRRAALRLCASFTPMLLERFGSAPFVGAIVNPAKLAALLAERGRQLGLNLDVEARENGVMVCVLDGLPLPPLSFRTMASARAILAAWLELDDGDRDNDEKALRG